MLAAILFLSILVQHLPLSKSLNLANCRSALGMQSGEIPNFALSASSSLDETQLGPHCARIREDIMGGAWCPSVPVSDLGFEYLQISFDSLKVITLIETQGRFNQGQGHEYVEEYMIKYQRNNNSSNWFVYKNRRDEKMLPGNENTYRAELRELIPPIVAKSIRIHPYNKEPKNSCLRLEIYGCSLLEGIVSYDMRQGERRSQDLDFSDKSYDGISIPIRDTHLINIDPYKPQKFYLSSGLGQLTDGSIGSSNFRVDSEGSGVKGYDWVGWKRDVSNDPVEITFKFDQIRRFETISFYTNNLRQKDVSVFSSAQIFFSRGTSAFQNPPINYRHDSDTRDEDARWVVVPLQGREASLIKIWLFFEAKWMLVSEVSFDSEIVKLTTENVDIADIIEKSGPLLPEPQKNQISHRQPKDSKKKKVPTATLR